MAVTSFSRPGLWEGDVQQRAIPLHGGKQSGCQYLILAGISKFYKPLIQE